MKDFSVRYARASKDNDQADVCGNDAELIKYLQCRLPLDI